MLTSPKIVPALSMDGSQSEIIHEGITVSLGKGAISTSDECRTYWCSRNGEFDFLVLFDSRGAMLDSPGSMSLVEMLKQYFTELGASFLILSRPLYLTVFPTLLNVLESEKLKVKHVITNVGFVDTTPKKGSVLEDLQAQIYACGLDSTLKVLGEYTLSNGETELLATNEVSNNSILELSERLSKNADSFCFVNTPVLDQKMLLPRPRPTVFYQQLTACNELIDEIAVILQGQVIDISLAGLSTFDGVHYRSEEHQFIFSRLKHYVEGLGNIKRRS